MRFKRIDVDTVRCIISEEELMENGLEVDDFLQNDGRTESFLRKIISMAEEEVGYKVQGGNMLENLKSAVESLVKNAPDIEKLKQTSKELANQNHTDEGIAEIQPEQSDSKAEESTDKKQSTGGFTLKDRNFYQLCFASMERAIFYAKGVRLELPMKSSLYYLTREDAYYLLLEKGELSDKQLCRLLSASLEFADDIYAHGPTRAYIMEHGKCILPEQALEHLQEI